MVRTDRVRCSLCGAQGRRAGPSPSPGVLRGPGGWITTGGWALWRCPNGHEWVEWMEGAVSPSAPS